MDLASSPETVNCMSWVNSISSIDIKQGFVRCLSAALVFSGLAASFLAGEWRTNICWSLWAFDLESWKHCQEFATLDASIGYCFKLMIEGEYTWHWLSYSWAMFLVRYTRIYQKGYINSLRLHVVSGLTGHITPKSLALRRLAKTSCVLIGLTCWVLFCAQDFWDHTRVYFPYFREVETSIVVLRNYFTTMFWMWTFMVLLNLIMLNLVWNLVEQILQHVWLEFIRFCQKGGGRRTETPAFSRHETCI